MYYAELGLGNPTVVSTEIERGSREKRIRGFVVRRYVGWYIRVRTMGVELIVGSELKLKGGKKGNRLVFGIVSR